MVSISSTNQRLGGVPSVFTIHNLAYQGIVAPNWLTRLGLGQDLFHLDRLEFCGNISFLKGGVMFARTVTTVSPRYAEEYARYSGEQGQFFTG